MKCSYPQKGSRTVKGTAFSYEYPCGQCMPCRITKRQSWTFRILAEMLEWPYVYFVTLTYDDVHLPEWGSLCSRDLTLFFKRLRKRGFVFRYFAVGEYGDRTYRPHYHVVFYSESPILGSVNKNDHLTSGDLFDSWKKDGDPIGIVHCVPVFAGLGDDKIARYVAGYCLKKLTGERRFEALVGPAVKYLEPEFSRVSKGRQRGVGGLGARVAYRLGLRAKRYGIEEVMEEGIYMVRFQGKKWPLDRTMRTAFEIGLRGEVYDPCVLSLEEHEKWDRKEAIKAMMRGLGKNGEEEKRAIEQARLRAEKVYGWSKKTAI